MFCDSEVPGPLGALIASASWVPQNSYLGSRGSLSAKSWNEGRGEARPAGRWVLTVATSTKIIQRQTPARSRGVPKEEFLKQLGVDLNALDNGPSGIWHALLDPIPEISGKLHPCA